MRYIFIEGCLVQIVHIYFVDLIVVLYSLEENYLTRHDDYNYGPYQIGEDEIFVMGDNRPVSLDCRQLGPIPRDYIYGRVIFVAFPFNEIRGTMAVPEY